ncbi:MULTISPECIES: restriction endonuclease subunit S [Klebsiella]|uniref:restriction endonuclease subunit S n=1 Tax=Klebsiella TaxID=570 RepID=UPI00083FC313|nr:MULTISPECIES: restriction endonuclease subunit S [Klebsiella]HCI6017333.1 restriction endonuclease subunit S [Klebsiella quasipneumoniae subsp. similipneumoniae]EKV7466904.1 restriction endonuclease subunit S [Klebsiella pneumoniae]EKZ9764682.1 restriction endonuclease subunit S [Klebsiella pneumoniae]ELA0973317.1 restriction endonuclease subunit S [Klebsiella pneumoniae]ELB5209074.1 restriction endonuclease subunit S [Klebsiella pneumoniae]
MVPKGWTLGTLKDLADTIMGYAFRSEDFVPTGIPLLRMGNLYQNTLDLNRNPVYLPDSFKFDYKRFLVSPGDLVMSMTGTMGKRDYGFTVEIPSNTQYSLLNQRVLKIVPKNNASSGYILNLLRSELILSVLYSFPGGTKQANLSAKQLQEIPVLIPPELEQKKIAQILSTWDKAISVTEKLLANSQRQKKALMQQLLTGKKRLLDENGTRFSETWKLYALSKLFQRVTTKNNGKSNNVVTISGQHGLIKQEDFFKKTVASDTLDGYFLLKKGQFAYNKSYSNGYPMGAIKRLNRYPEGVVTTLYICFELTIPKKSCGDYWEHYFESGLLNNSLSQIAHEGGRAHGLLNVKPSDFFSLKVAVPGFEEQQKIASVLSAADTEISTLEKKLACLKDEKKALMQQLLTGKRRVKVDEAVAV